MNPTELRRLLRVLSFIVLMGLGTNSRAQNWPGFRGPTGDGIAPGAVKLPIEFDPSTNLVWRTGLSAGHSSPIVWGDRIFVTGSFPAERKLEVICIALKTGDIQWRKSFIVEALEKVHRISNPATGTSVTDGEHVVSFFGSFGLICHDFQGRELWRHPLPRYDSMNGCGTSPALYEGTVLLNREDLVDQSLLALDVKTGLEKWRFKHPNTEPNELGVASTPLVWHDQILIHRAGSLSSHSPKDGSVNWFVPANTTGCGSPIVAGTHVIFCAWNNAGEPALIPPWPSYSDLLKQYDRDHDGKLTYEEFPRSLSVATRPGLSKDWGTDIPFEMVWDMFDPNHDKVIDAEEFARGITTVNEYLKKNKHGITAVNLLPDGSPAERAVAWKIERGVPEVPSPVAYDGRAYFIRNSGLFTCVDIDTGKIIYDERLGISDPFFASPLVAGGLIYVASATGKVAVIKPGDTLTILARNDLKEPIFASPATVGNQLLVRTTQHLFAFANPPAAH